VANPTKYAYVIPEGNLRSDLAAAAAAAADDDDVTMMLLTVLHRQPG